MDIKKVAKWFREILETGCEPCIFCEHTDLKGMAEACERFTWRPIETAPRDGSIVLCYSKKRWTADVSPMKWVDEWKCAASGHRLGIDEQPTHWMPLPKAPQP